MENLRDITSQKNPTSLIKKLSVLYTYDSFPCSPQAGLDFVLPAVADGMSFSATGITLAVIRRQLKDLHKKVDLLLGSVGETAKDKFEEAMVSLENDNFRCE